MPSGGGSVVDGSGEHRVSAAGSGTAERLPWCSRGPVVTVESGPGDDDDENESDDSAEDEEGDALDYGPMQDDEAMSVPDDPDSSLLAAIKRLSLTKQAIEEQVERNHRRIQGLLSTNDTLVQLKQEWDTAANRRQIALSADLEARPPAAAGGAAQKRKSNSDEPSYRSLSSGCADGVESSDQVFRSTGLPAPQPMECDWSDRPSPPACSPPGPLCTDVDADLLTSRLQQMIHMLNDDALWSGSQVNARVRELERVCGELACYPADTTCDSEGAGHARQSTPGTASRAGFTRQAAVAPPVRKVISEGMASSRSSLRSSLASLSSSDSLGLPLGRIDSASDMAT